MKISLIQNIKITNKFYNPNTNLWLLLPSRTIRNYKFGSTQQYLGIKEIIEKLATNFQNCNFKIFFQ